MDGDEAPGEIEAQQVVNNQNPGLNYQPAGANPASVRHEAPQQDDDEDWEQLSHLTFEDEIFEIEYEIDLRQQNRVHINHFATTRDIFAQRDD